MIKDRLIICGPASLQSSAAHFVINKTETLLQHQSPLQKNTEVSLKSANQTQKVLKLQVAQAYLHKSELHTALQDPPMFQDSRWSYVSGDYYIQDLVFVL